MLLTTWEASQKYNLSTSHLRRLLGGGTLKGRAAQITSQRSIWMIDEKSLQQYLAKGLKPGPKKKKIV
jgi:hypothetical protein